MITMLIFMAASSPRVFGQGWGLKVGPDYATYLLYQNDEEPKGRWQFGGAIEVEDVIPNIGLKVRGSRVKYQSGDHAWEYTPVSFCTSFNLLPFLRYNRLRLTLETGMGVYFWRSLLKDEVMVLPNNTKAIERDPGFVIGTTLELRPTRLLVLQGSIRYNYIASSNIYKYGFADKDDRLLEIGFGVRAVRHSRRY
jgi:hypothetical protein